MTGPDSAIKVGGEVEEGCCGGVVGYRQADYVGGEVCPAAAAVEDVGV